MKVAAPLRRKAKLKLRSLIGEINELHHACQTVSGRVVPGGVADLEHLDDVIIALDHALASIRTLDKELFEPSGSLVYEKLRSDAENGRVVRGLTAPRNAAVHYQEIIDPDVPRAVGPVHGRFIISPRWKDRSAIPADAFRRTASGALRAYDEAVAGRLLHDTLLDALQFFDQCDGELLERDAEGQVQGLPLSPLPIPGYHRLRHDWPSHEDVEARIRSNTRAAPPGGSKRRIDGFVQTADGTYLFGYTQLASGHAQAFTEPIDQVTADISMGYRYEALIGGVRQAIDTDGSALLVGGAPLAATESDLANLSDAGPWVGWAELAATDAAYYRDQRAQGRSVPTPQR